MVSNNKIMKILFTLFFLMLIICEALCQGGELKYNQSIVLNGTLSPIKKVKTVAYGAGTTTDTSFFFLDSVTITVPVNKTLKLENVSTGGRTVIYNQNAAGIITNIVHSFPSPSGGFVVGYNSSIASAGWALDSYILLQNTLIYKNERAGSTPIATFPIWLPSGTYKFMIEGSALTNNNATNSAPHTYRNDARLYYFISGIEFNIIP